jgi:hypothetical protein
LIGDYSGTVMSESRAAPAPHVAVGRRTLWPTVLALALFLGLAILNTLPMALQFTTTGLGAGGDAVHYLWFMWWIRDALASGVNPHETSLIYWPEGAKLYVGTTPFVDGFIVLPVQWLAGLFAAYNTLVLLKFSLSAFCAYLLARYLWRDYTAALLAGIAYGFCTYLAAHAVGGHMALLSVMFMPLAALWLFRAAAGDGRRYVVLAALALAANVPMLHYALYMAVFAALFLAWQTVRLRRDLPLVRRIWLRVLVTGLLALVFSAPLLALLLTEIARTASNPTMIYAYGADLLAYVVPSLFHPLFGPLVRDFTMGFVTRGNIGEALVFPGYTVLLLAAAALLLRERPRPDSAATRPLDLGAGFWALVALCFGVLSLGVELRVNGQYTGLPLPYALLNRLPLWGSQSAPSRFEIVAQLALAMLAAAGLVAVRARLAARGRLRAARLCNWLPLALLTFEFLSFPFRTFALPDPSPFFAQLAADPDQYAVLNVPMLGGPDRDAWAQTFHHKPIIGGYVTRPRQDYLPHSLLGPFQELQLYFPPFEPDIVSFDLARDGLPVLRSFGVRYLLVHRDLLEPPYPQRTADLLRTMGLGEPVYQDDTLAAYCIPPAAGPERVVAIARWLRPSTRPSYLEPPARATDGLVYRETVADTTLIGIWSSEATRVTLEVPMWSLGGATPLTFFLNDAPVVSAALTDERQILQVPLDLRPGSNFLALQGRAAIGPMRILPPGESASAPR